MMSADRDLMQSLTRQIQQQSEQIRQQTEAQKGLLEIIETMKADREPMVGAPRKSKDIEFIIETLANSMTEFVFDLDSNSTFENWYVRYKDLFADDAKQLDEKAKIRLLLRKFNNQAYSKYVNVILPREPQEISFDETISKLNELFGPGESTFNTRYQCLQIYKTDGMNIGDYQALVNKAVEKFKFSDMTSDQFKCLVFVRGLTSKSDVDTRVRLLSKLDSNDELTLDKLVAEYKRLINYKRDSTAIQSRNEGGLANVNKISKKSKSKNKTLTQATCWNCGNKKHSRDECPARNVQCNHCNRTGHKSEFCRKHKKAMKDDPEGEADDRKAKGDSKSKNDKSSNRTVKSICINQINSTDRKFIDILINQQQIQLQIDSAADVTVISRESCIELNLDYTSTSLQPNDASGNTLNLVGEIICDVTFQDKTISSKIYVSDSNTLNVFGIDLIKKFNLWRVPFDDICADKRVHQVIQPDSYANFLQQRFPSCFETTLGKCTKFEAHLQLKEGAYPTFNKNRPVPFAIQPRIEAELNRLEKLGVISPTTTAKCAAPIVVTQKKNGDIRICADFSAGLNEALEDTHYHFQKIFMQSSMGQTSLVTLICQTLFCKSKSTMNQKNYP